MLCILCSSDLYANIWDFGVKKVCVSARYRIAQISSWDLQQVCFSETRGTVDVNQQASAKGTEISRAEAGW